MHLKFATLFASAALLPAASASAADSLKFAPPPPWVIPQTAPSAAAKATEAPVSILLSDEQIRFEPGKITRFQELSFKIEKPEGLAAGNLSLSWDPANDIVTVNKVEIHRDGKLIDVLASGQKFTTLRRESNLELATLDGVLTANLQPEGLQEGDILVLASTTEHSDPALKGHVEAAFASWSSTQIALAHARLSWPSSLDLKVRDNDDQLSPRQESRAGRKAFELTMRNVQPTIAPKSAPVRYKIGRLGEATDFRSWADAAALMMPLYHEAAVIPASGPLRDEVEKIRKASTDPVIRGEQALQLVEQRVRYVALLMGQGGLVPASAESTWSRRFGDCKAKTTLLLAILHELGIEAEPVLVNSSLGDAIAERLPMIALFNHVLVRAHIGGSDYWLDGTRTGDSKLSNLKVPDFGWGLPLVAKASLVRIVPSVELKPQSELTMSIDASSGAYAPAKVEIVQLVRGDTALALDAAMSQLAANQRDEALKMLAKKYFDALDVASVTTAFDKDAAELCITAQGTGKLSWRDRWFYVPSSSIGYSPDFSRAAGRQQQAPFATDYPDFETTHVTVHMPPGFLLGQKKIPLPVHETIAGIEYARSAIIKGDTLTVDTSARTIAPEISYAEAKAAESRLKNLADDNVYLSLSDTLRATDADVKALADNEPDSAQAYIDRGLIFLNRRDYGRAMADFEQALKLDPSNNWALANRAIASAWKKDFVAADRDLAELEKRDPNHVMLLRARGLKAEILGDYDSAADFYSKAVERDPTDLFSASHKAAAFAAGHHEDKAIASLDAALKSNPDWTELRAMRANLLANQGKKDDAAAEADTLVKNAPNSLQNLITAAGIYARIGMNDRARQALDQAAAQPDQSAVAWASRAQVLNSLGDVEGALKASDQAIKLGFSEPGFRLSRINMMMNGKRDLVPAEIEAMLKDSPASSYAFVVAGKTYAALGKNEQAMHTFDRAIAIKPEAYIYVNRQQVRPRNDIVHRMADLDAALRLEPDMPEALTAKAELLTDSGDFKNAIALFDRVKSNPGDPMLQTLRAVTLYKAGRTEESRKLFESVRATTHTAMGLNNLCWAKATADILLESALLDCRDALKLNPDIGGYEDSLGMVLLKLGKLDEALSAYNAAIAKRVGATSLMGRAMVYARKGDRARANADAAAARKQDAQIDAIFAGFGLKP
jgi:tetratricopeptide (TPR) repeat protein